MCKPFACWLCKTILMHVLKKQTSTFVSIFFCNRICAVAWREHACVLYLIFTETHKRKLRKFRLARCICSSICQCLFYSLVTFEDAHAPSWVSFSPISIILFDMKSQKNIHLNHRLQNIKRIWVLLQDDVILLQRWCCHTHWVNSVTHNPTFMMANWCCFLRKGDTLLIALQTQ